MRYFYSTAIVRMILLCCAFGQDNLYPIEPRGEAWTPPADESDFRKNSVGAKYVGMLFSGVTEFNWIVDVRVKNESEGYSSIGNLVTYHHVLTSCRAARLMMEKSKYRYEKKIQQEYDWEVFKYPYGSDIVVNYCRNYLFQDSQDVRLLDRGLTGTRFVLQIVPHPTCTKLSLVDDAAVMIMNRGISAVVPRVGYMPVNLDYRLEKTLPTEPVYLGESALCFVASFGRGYYNLDTKDNPALGYKVKYRVYIADWQLCTGVYNYICNGYYEEQCKDKTRKQNLLCYSARAKVGAVCDHDRGAPVVCHDQVVGIVIRGAKEQECSNLYHIPFIVLQIDDFKSFLDQTIELLVRPVAQYDGDVTTTPTPHGGVQQTCKTTIPLLLSSAIFTTAIVPK